MSYCRAEADIVPDDLLLSEMRTSEPSHTANYLIVIRANSSAFDDVRSRSSQNICGENNRQSCTQYDKYLILQWWACLDSNLQPDRYERRSLPGSSSKISVFRSRSSTFVRVCSRGFCWITGGMEDRREPPTGFDRTGPRFVRQAEVIE